MVKVETVRQSISIITRVLSGKGIKVTQSGTNAYVESKKGIPVRVNIPYIPDNASEELMIAINGFLDHEVAHVLFTDFKASTSDKFKNPSVFSIYNVLEDCRIEKLMQEKFAGSKMNLQGVAKFFLDRYTTPEFEKAKETGDPKTIVMSISMPAIRAWSGQEVFQNYMKGKEGFIKPLEDAIKSEIPKIGKLKSTKEAIALAHVIHDLLTKSSEEPEEPKKEPKQKAKTGGTGETPEDKGKSTKPTEPDEVESSKDESSEGENPSDGNPAPESDSSDSEKDEEGEEGGSDESENEGESEPEEESKEEGEEPEKPEEEETEEEEKSEPKDESEESEKDEEESEEGEGESDEEEESEEEPEDEEESEEEPVGEMREVNMELGDVMGDGGDMLASVASIISEQIKLDLKDIDYKIFSTDFDKIEPFPVPSNMETSARMELERIQEELKKLSGPLQKTLERLVRAKATSRNLPGKRSGKINPSSLYRLKVADNRVFRQKAAGYDDDVAFSLLVDCSGSMGGEKMRLALESAYALSDVLSKLNISNEVIGFTTFRTPKMQNAIAAEGSSIRYSRVEPISMPIFKGFSEKFGPEQKLRIACGALSGEHMHNNIDGESLRYAAKRLLSMTKEKGKQLIVLSDGAPAGRGEWQQIQTDLHTAVADVENMGVQVIGIGIQDKNVERYYKNHLVIQNVHELPSLIIKELKEILIG